MKEIPNIIKIGVPFNREAYEALRFRYYMDVKVKNGYTFRFDEFDEFCAIVIRNLSKDMLPKYIIDYAFDDFETFKLKKKIFLYTLRLKSLKEKLTKEEDDILNEYYINRINLKYELFAKEIKKTGIKLKEISEKYQDDLDNLKKICGDFETETLIEWFFPVYWDLERFLHIFVKHVLETKFGEGQFKKRTFFQYQFRDIRILLKQVLKQEEQSIKDHFLEVKMNMHNKDYHRYGSKAILYNNDRYKLHINNEGRLLSFHQV